MRPVLVVLHQETSTAGRVGTLLAARGMALDIRRPRFGDPLPDTMDGHAGAVVFGGPMSANDGDDWLRRETDWLAVPLSEGAPLLGICLGAQMMVRHLGGRVAPHAGGRAEIGYYPLVPTDAGAALMDWPGHVYQWHREGFDLPAGATLLAAGGDFPNQAFQAGPAAFGLQFHPEVTHHMMCRWTTRGAERLCLPGAQPREHHFDGRALHDGAVRRWLGEFLELWLGRDRRAAADPARTAGAGFRLAEAAAPSR